jgi:NDP-sugar pyrophosphorylase family protein
MSLVMSTDQAVVATEEVHREPVNRSTERAAYADTDASAISGIVLAGSHHWGDSVFSRRLRGPLLPVAHVPLIQYPLQWLHEARIRNVLLCANTATPELRAVLGDGAAMQLSIRYFEDVEPRGPAGCARDAALTTDAQMFIVIEGTIIPTLDSAALLAQHRASGAVATVVVESDRRRRGMPGGARLQPAGVYVFNRSVLETVSETGYQDIKEGLLGRLSESGAHVGMHEVQGLSAKVLDYSSYAAVSRWLVTRGIERPVFLPHYVRVGEGLRHPRAEVHESARLVGPVLLGDGARVEANAVIVGPASIGSRSIVGAGALVSRSFIWDDCTIGPGAIVDASVLADRSTVEAGERLRSATQVPGDSAQRDRELDSNAAMSTMRVSGTGVAGRFRSGVSDIRDRVDSVLTRDRADVTPLQ